MQGASLMTEPHGSTNPPKNHATNTKLTKKTSHSLHAPTSPVSATFRCWLCGNPPDLLMWSKRSLTTYTPICPTHSHKKLPNSNTLNGLIHTTHNAGGNIFHHWTRWIWQTHHKPTKTCIQTFSMLPTHLWASKMLPMWKFRLSLCDRNALNDLHTALPHSLT